MGLDLEWENGAGEEEDLREGPRTQAPAVKRAPDAGLSSAQCRDVLRGRTLLALHNLKLDLLAFGQELKTASLNGREVDEDVRSAICRRDKAETLGLVEPFHGAR